MNEEHYKQSIAIAKQELDELLPTFLKMQERVQLLRRFITSGHVLSGQDARDLDDKYSIIPPARAQWSGENRNRFPRKHQ